MDKGVEDGHYQHNIIHLCDGLFDRAVYESAILKIGRSVFITIYGTNFYHESVHVH